MNSVGTFAAFTAVLVWVWLIIAWQVAICQRGRYLEHIQNYMRGSDWKSGVATEMLSDFESVSPSRHTFLVMTFRNPFIAYPPRFQAELTLMMMRPDEEGR